MSYLRMGQEGQYVDIPFGSNYYLYDNGHDIEGWSYGEWAALIGSTIDEIDYETEQPIKDAFEDHYDGWDEDYNGGIAPPERAEIFCQCVDRRIDRLELTPALHRVVRKWAEEDDGVEECEYCGTTLRPYIRVEPLVCSDEECELQNMAEQYGVSVERMREVEAIEDFDEYWAALEELRENR